MLRVNQLSRRYGSFVAADDVSFTIGRGEIVGLLGHNGAGKTTIMKMISGYLEPNGGQVEVDGVDLAIDPKRVQRHLGYLPENLPVYPEMTVADYLDYAADLKGLTGNEKLDEIRRAIKSTDIKSKLLAPIETLSRGYKQRVGVAQAILGRPKLLILDEPTNGLDPEQTQHMRTLIRDIACDATVILSTHIMQEVNALCSRVLMLRGGKLVLDETLDNIQKSHFVELECSLDYERATVLNAIDGVESVELIDSASRSKDANSYRIAVQEEADVQYICASLSRALSEEGAALYSLSPVHRDLEVLFKEVNEAAVNHGIVTQGGQKNAA